MREKEKMEGAYEKYALEENHEFYVSCSEIEGEGYCQWPRLKETVEFCKKMGYKKIGLAFCRGLRKEARVVADLFTAQGFDVVSVICKTGGFPKESVGIPKEKKVNADAFEPMCNPISRQYLIPQKFYNTALLFLISNIFHLVCPHFSSLQDPDPPKPYSGINCYCNLFLKYPSAQ
mgnify:CR=1 FL=1